MNHCPICSLEVAKSGEVHIAGTVCHGHTLQGEENISAVVGFLVLVIIFWIGYNLGVFVTNKLREPTWHSPKGCPLYVQTNK